MNPLHLALLTALLAAPPVAGQDPPPGPDPPVPPELEGEDPAFDDEAFWGEEEPGSGDLSGLSLEELMNIEVEVTSVARRKQRLSDSAAAVYVITQEDIRRSGATCIPDLLRMVPGLSVSRISSNTWAIGARGFNAEFADKLLVMIDGRTVYTPLFSGMFWDVQDYPLDDIERIEVIRGPGASLWGANAVNGVINIITKSARDTQGNHVRLGAGNEERGFGHVRHGGSFGEDGAWRVYAKYFNRDGSGATDAVEPDDDWEMGRGGFRMDWSSSETDSLTFQGDVYKGRVDNTYDLASFTSPPTALVDNRFDVSGGNLLMRWSRELSEDSGFSLQVYYDHTNRESDIVDLRRDTMDVDFQHNLPLSERNELIWGMGYRYSASDITSGPVLGFYPENRDTQLFSAFVQDEHRLGEELTAMLGAKVEHNDYTGLEFQPNARLLWNRSSQETVWASIAGAVRQPAQMNEDISWLQQVIQGPGYFILPTLFGSDDFDSEKLTAYELGYRNLIGEDFSLDLAAFYNEYRELMTMEPGDPFATGAGLVVPVYFANGADGWSWGLEAAAQWNVREDWKLNLSYSFIDIHIQPHEGSNDPSAEDEEKQTPAHQVHLRSYFDLSEEWGLDAALYWVDAMEKDDISDYFRADTRLAWEPCEGISAALVAQGLFHDRELEFGQSIFNAGSEVETSVFLTLSWQF